eukprot:jgi/Botrbrau1/723/Bobra.160_2s0046.1
MGNFTRVPRPFSKCLRVPLAGTTAVHELPWCSSRGARALRPFSNCTGVLHPGTRAIHESVIVFALFLISNGRGTVAYVFDVEVVSNIEYQEQVSPSHGGAAPR